MESMIATVGDRPLYGRSIECLLEGETEVPSEKDFIASVYPPGLPWKWTSLPAQAVTLITQAYNVQLQHSN
jgi:hypothetical protein